MTRYKGRTRTSQRDFPHRVEMIVPKGGFGKRLDEMHEWHRARSIRPRFRSESAGREQSRLRDVVFCRCSDGGQFSDLIHPVVNDEHSLRAIAGRSLR